MGNSFERMQVIWKVQYRPNSITQAEIDACTRKTGDNTFIIDYTKILKERLLFLDTDTMPLGVRLALMYLVETENILYSSSLVRFRSYFVDTGNKFPVLDKKNALPHIVFVMN